MRLIADAAQVWMVRDGVERSGWSKKNNKKQQQETVRRTKFTIKTDQSERK